MKRIKTYKLFESANINSLYEELTQILYSEIFDDYNIVAKTTESFNDEENYPFHKFWAFRSEGLHQQTQDDDFSDITTDKIIDKLIIFGIPENELGQITELLNDVKQRFESSTGKQLQIVKEGWGDHVYDFVLKIYTELSS